MSEIRVKSTGTIKLFESDNTSHVTIASPASLSANRTITIPDADVTLGAVGASTLNELTDVSMDITNFTDSLLIQTNSNGSAPTTGTLSGASNNVGIGKDVFQALTSGNENSVIGTAAGQSLTTGVGNVFMGLSAGTQVTTGGYNVFIGRGAGDGHDAENYNIGIGKDVLGGSINGGEYNVGIGGDECMIAVTSGDHNTGIGKSAGQSLTTGDSNTLIGSNSGNGIVGGDKNVMIGYNVQVSGGSGNHQIGIGDSFSVGGDNDFSFGKASNIVTNDFDADANWSRSSDRRKKREIYDQELGLDFINDLRTVRFQWKPSNEFPKEWNDYSEENNMDTDVIMHGFIAQEVKETLDKYANDKDIKFSGWKEGDDGMQHTSREMFVIPLIKAVQELSAEVKELKTKLEAK